MPAVAGANVPGLVGALKLALPQPFVDLHLAHAQHHQISLAIAIHIEGVGTHGIGELQARAVFLQLKCAAPRAAVAVKLGFVDPGSHIHLGQSISIAIEGGHTAAHHVFAFAFKAALQAGGVGLFLKAGRGWQRAGHRHLSPSGRATQERQPQARAGQKREGKSHAANLYEV